MKVPGIINYFDKKYLPMGRYLMDDIKKEEKEMNNKAVKSAILLLIFIVGIPVVYKINASSTENHEDATNPRLPLSVEALIPRHAIIIWDSVIHYGPDGEDMAVLYSTPVIGANDSLKYFEIFMVDEKGIATPRDRIYLGGRGLYLVDKVTKEDATIAVHAREHQAYDSIANPTRHVDIIIEYGRGAITVSKQYPKESEANKCD